MKLSTVCASVAVFAAAVLGQDAEPAAAANVVVDPNFVPTPEKPFNIAIESVLQFKEHDGQIEDLFNGETVELLYNVTSFEPELLTVLGVGGELLDPVSGEIAANITAAKIGPIEIANNSPSLFTQKIGINLTPGAYILSPAIYVVYDEQFMQLGTQTKLVNVTEAHISIFNPQLIIAEVILAATVLAIAYGVYVNFGDQFLPASLVMKKKSKKPSAKKSDSEGETSASASDIADWLPESHKATKRKSKKRA